MKSKIQIIISMLIWGSVGIFGELVQLKLNIETSGGDSTPPEAKSGNSTL